MRKLVVIATILFILFISDVKAADQNCTVTFSQHQSKNEIYVQLSSDVEEAGRIYIGKLMSNTSNESTVGFCLDLHKSSQSGKQYSNKLTEPITITETMKKSYEFTKNLNFNNEQSVIKYLIAQLAVWFERETKYKYTNPRFLSVAMNAVQSYYCGKDKSGCDIIRLKSLRNSATNLVSDYITTRPTTENLCVYEVAGDNPNNRIWQRFVGKCITMDCRKQDHTYCDAPYDNVDITDCLKEGKSKETCEQEKGCFSQKECGFQTKIIGSPAVCTNDGQQNRGDLTEIAIYDPNNCGTATENGTLNKPLGEYCNLYCKEEVVQLYPGGIANPVSIGTSIIWPTSSESINTPWKNRYELKYIGKKTCKIQMKDSQEIIEDIANYAALANQYRGEISDVTNNHGGNCSNKYGSRISLENQKKDAEEQKDKICDEASNKAQECQKKDCAAEERACDQKVRDWEEKNEAYQNCQNSLSSNCIDPGPRPTACSIIRENCNREEQNICNNAQTLKNNCTNAEKTIKNIENKIQNLGICETAMDASRKGSEIIKELNTCLLADFKPTNDAEGNVGIYNFKSDTSFSYSDEEYGESYQLKGNTTYSCEGCGHTSILDEELTLAKIRDKKWIQDLIAALLNRTITVTATATYTLPTDSNAYRYTLKESGKPLKKWITGAIDWGYSFLPTSYTKYDTKKKYDLVLTPTCLGEDCKFSEYLKANSAENYTCNYQVTDQTSTSCVCPIGTDFVGQDLMPIIYSSNVNGKPITCADAQHKYCNGQVFCPSDEVIEITSCLKNEGKGLTECVEQYCPGGSGTTYCPDGKTDISACLKRGNSYDYCINTLCNINTDDFHCPKGTFNDGMDIKPCVFSVISQNGYTIEEAKAYCVNTVCPGGKTIIYRTIDLRIPFSGKTAGLGKNQTTKAFNLDSWDGRYPGANWNSVELVKNQILYNRNVEANKVYTKTPLYSFELDTKTIKKIREYNKQQVQNKKGGYSDWTLDCNSNGVACISGFVHNNNYGLVGGECSSNSKNDFYVCSER